MYHDLDEFNKLMGQVEAKSTFIPKAPNTESVLDLGNYNMEPVHEGILQNGINRMSNILSANLKSKISGEWKHLDEEERRLLLRTIAGNSSAFEDTNGIEVALAQAFKDKALLPTKAEDGTAAIIINKDVDISNSGAAKFPQISIQEIKGNLKCNYSTFSTFNGFPDSVKSIEFAKGKSQIENLEGLPDTTGRNDANYSIDLKNTKINSLKGWRSRGTVKGHVSFRGCDLKDVNVDASIYIAGSLDIRDNPHISIESLKAIVLKDYSKNQIIVKGQIYHTLEEDGFYSTKKIKSDDYSQEDLGALTEATANKQGSSISQEELWKIGPEIIRQAEERKSKKEAGSIKDSLSKKIKPEVQSIVKDMASSQLDRNSVAQASQKITRGMSSDEFRTMMKGLFDNLLKQLNELMRNTNGGDSSKVEKSIETITKVTAETAASEMEKFEKLFDAMMEKDGCLDTNALNASIDSIIKSISPLAAKGPVELKSRINDLSQNSSDRNKYELAVNAFLKTLYIDILGYSRVDPKLAGQIVDKCFGSEEAQSEAPDAQEAPSDEQAPTTAQEEPTAPDGTPEPAVEPNALETKPAEQSQTKVKTQGPATVNPSELPKPVQAKAPTTSTPSNYSEKERKGLERFRALLNTPKVTSNESKKKNSEEK
jgi:hypothetical protein